MACRSFSHLPRWALPHLTRFDLVHLSQRVAPAPATTSAIPRFDDEHGRGVNGWSRRRGSTVPGAATLPLSFLKYPFQRFHAERLKGILVEGELSEHDV